jgi:methyltransferase FkbM-like protein
MRFLPALLERRGIDIVKIDVEGFEKQVLKGMEQLIVAHRPVIFCEIFGGHHSIPDPESTVQYFNSLGYDAFVLSDGRLASAGVYDDKLYSYFFIPRNPR